MKLIEIFKKFYFNTKSLKLCIFYTYRTSQFEYSRISSTQLTNSYHISADIDYELSCVLLKTKAC